MSYNPLTELKDVVEDASVETNQYRLSRINENLVSIDKKLGRILIHLEKITEKHVK